MAVERIPIIDREQWLARRKSDITASVVGAAFGCHSYVSPLRLYVEKQGLVDLPGIDGTVLRRGRIMEPAIPGAVLEQRPDSGWRIEKCTDYFSDPQFGIGATPDFFIHGDPRGLGALQGKTTLPHIYDRDWQTDEHGTITPPRWITLQLATEMMLTDAAFGVVACLVMDPYDLPCVIVEQTRDTALEKQICEQVVAFWQRIQDGDEPDADFGLDRSLLAQILPKETPDLTIDLTCDNEVIDGLIERQNLKAEIKKNEERCKKIETMVMSRMKLAAYALVPDFTVTWKQRPRKEYVVPASTPRVLDIRAKKERGSGPQESAA
jgi:predicted phage-related endonuclease